MKQNNRLGISLSILIFWTGLLIGGEPFAGLRGRRVPRKIKKYYEVIGIEGFGKILDDANQDADVKGAKKRRAIEGRQATIDELEAKFPEEKDKKALEEQIYKLNVELRKAFVELAIGRSGHFVSYIQEHIPHAEIAKKCKEKRKDIKEKREKLGRELSEGRLSPSVQEKKELEFMDLMDDERETAHVCPVLLDKKSRTAYDQSLSFPPPEQAKSLIEALKQGLLKFIKASPETLVTLNDIAGKLLAEQLKGALKELFGDIPEATAKIFNQNIALRSIDFLPKPSGRDVRYWVGFSGLMALNTFDVRASMYIIQDIYGITRISFSVELPEYYKLSNLIPGFTYLDTFSLPKSKLIFSSFEYFDRVQIRKGLTFVAEVDFAGPLQVLHDMKEKSKRFKSLVFDNEPAMLSGYLSKGIIKDPKKFLDSEFKILVPFHFGFDLRKISVIPQEVSKVVNQITSDDFRLTIRPGQKREVREERAREKVFKEALPFAESGPRGLKETELAREVAREIEPLYPKKESRFLAGAKDFAGRLSDFIKFNIEAEAGARVVLGTQEDPLSLTLLGSIRPAFDIKSSSLLVAANLKNMLELKWLALGDATIQFEWDAALMAVAAEFGVPFTGFGLKGKVDLGKPGESRAHFDLAGGFRVSSSEVPDLLFSVEGRNIRFADLLSYASYLASKARLLKKPVSLERIPTMTFEAVKGYASLSDMRIGDRSYPAGLGIEVQTDFFNKKFGFGINMDNEFKLFGFGYTPRIDATIRGRELFKLYGSRQADRGLHVAFEFDPKKPVEGRFALDGVLEIPSIRLKQDVLFKWDGWILDTTFETTLGGITVLFGVSLNVAPEEQLRKLPAEEEEEEEPELEGVVHEGKLEAAPEGGEREEEPVKEPVGPRAKPRRPRRTLLQRVRADIGETYEAGQRVGAKARAFVGKKLAPARKLVAEKVGKPVRKFVTEKAAEPLRKFVAKKLKKPLEKLARGAARQMFVKFGFTHEFAAYMTKTSTALLQKMKASASKKLKAAMEKMLALKAQGAQGFDAEIERVRRSVARTQEKIERARKECGQARWYKKFVCAKVAAYQAALVSKKSYLNALLKPTKAVVSGAAQLAVSTLQKVLVVQEFALESALSGLELINAGLNIVKIKEIYGEYSAKDVLALKLPKIISFIAELNIFDEPIVVQLENIQFDLKHPWAAVADITEQALKAGLTASVGPQMTEYAEMVQPLVQ